MEKDSLNVDEFKARLGVRRKMKGLGQKELGDLIGILKPTISNWERLASSRLPSLRDFANICEALDESADYLLFGKTIDKSTEEGLIFSLMDTPHGYTLLNILAHMDEGELEYLTKFLIRSVVARSIPSE